MSGVPGEGYTTRQVQIIATCTMCMTVSTCAIGLRLGVRRIAVVANLWWDDWLVVAGLVRQSFVAFKVARSPLTTTAGFFMAGEYFDVPW